MTLKIFGAAVLAVAAMSLGACNTLGGLGVPGNNGVVNDAVAKFLTDPSCAHSDELHVAIGPVSSGTLDLKRQCNGPPTAVVPVAPAAPAVK